MPLLLSICVIIWRTLTVDSAPMLGHPILDPLDLEAGKKSQNCMSCWKNGALKPQVKNELLIQKDTLDESDDDFLENNDDNGKKNEESNSISTQTPTRGRIKDIVDIFKSTQSSRRFTEIPDSSTNSNNRSDTPKLNLRNNHKERKCGYDFDENVCKQIGSRIICGYNKNQGNIVAETDITNIGNDCRIRGGRIECGYFEPPFNNPRRPMANDAVKLKKRSGSTASDTNQPGIGLIKLKGLIKNENANEKNNEELISESPILKVDTSSITEKSTLETNTEVSHNHSTDHEQKGSSSIAFSLVKRDNEKQIHKLPSVPETIQKCVETGDRVVCYEYLLKNKSKA